MKSGKRARPIPTTQERVWFLLNSQKYGIYSWFEDAVPLRIGKSWELMEVETEGSFVFLTSETQDGPATLAVPIAAVERLIYALQKATEFAEQKAKAEMMRKKFRVKDDAWRLPRSRRESKGGSHER